MRASGVRKYIDFRTKYNIRIYDNYSLERIVTTEYLYNGIKKERCIMLSRVNKVVDTVSTNLA